MSSWSGWKPFALESRAADLQPMGHGRPAGLHLGDVIRALKEAEDGPIKSIEGEQPWLRANMGFMWEWALELVAGGATVHEALDQAFKRHMLAVRLPLVRQIRLEVDGLHMTPDALADDEIESWKLTYRTKKRAATLPEFEEHFWPWHMAEKAYALHSGVTKCRFIVLWVCRDYKFPIGPSAEECTVEWSREELEANWAVVLEQVAVMKVRENNVARVKVVDGEVVVEESWNSTEGRN